MPEYTSCYNLLDEQWIPVLMHTGVCARLSLRETLLQARRIRALAASNPMDRAALLRFLLAVLYWCKGSPDAGERAQCLNYAQARGGAGPPEWADGFPAEWFADKLGAPGQPGPHHDCFNLLGDGQRFLQYRKSDINENWLPANSLIHEIPTGVYVNHFCHANDFEDGLCPACCAMGIIRLPAFVTIGGQGKSAGINSAPPVYLFRMGCNLMHSLLLNWTVQDNLGEPVWVSPENAIRFDARIPLLQGLTWVPRRIWLGDPGMTVGICISCGATSRLIHKTIYAGLGGMKAASGESGIDWRDPYVLYRVKRDGSPYGFQLTSAIKQASAASDQWSSLFEGGLLHATTNEPHFVNQRPLTDKVQWWLVGLATDQARLFEAREWVMAEPVGQDLADSMAIAAETMSQWQKSAGKFPSAVGRAVGAGGSRKSVETAALLAQVKPQAEHTLSQQAQRLAGAPPEAWRDAAAEAYAPLMQAVAQALAPGASVAATRKRREVAELAPQPQESPPPKPGKGAPKLQITPRTGGQP